MHAQFACLYFCKYGKPKFLRIVSQTGDETAVMCTYEQPASTAAINAKKKHKIDGKIYESKGVYFGFYDSFWSKSSAKPTITGAMTDGFIHSTPDHDSPLNILKILSDNHLVEVFKRLSLRDLCAVANTCAKFKLNAKQVFSARFINVDIDWLKEYEYSTVRIPMVLIANLFRNFGKYIEEISVNLNDIGIEHNDRVLSLILKYCTTTDSSLKALKISNFILSLHSMDEFRPIFGRLSRLAVDEMEPDHLKRLLEMCKNIRHLRLETVPFGRTHKQNFERLEEIELICVGELNNDKIKELFSMNRQLKRFVIHDPFDQLSSTIYQSMVKSPMLEHIEVETAIPSSGSNQEQDLLALAQLKHLKVFHFDCTSMPINALLNAFADGNVSMDDLSLKGLLLDSTNAESISKMNGLCTLRLLRTRGSNKGDFMNMIKKMQHLEHVFCGGSIKLSSNDIVEIIKFMPKLIKLHLTNQKDIVIGVDDFETMKKSLCDKRLCLTIIIWGDGLMVYPPKDLAIYQSNKYNNAPESKDVSMQFLLLNNVEDDSTDNTDNKRDGEYVIRMSDYTITCTPKKEED